MTPHTSGPADRGAGSNSGQAQVSPTPVAARVGAAGPGLLAGSGSSVISTLADALLDAVDEFVALTVLLHEQLRLITNSGRPGDPSPGPTVTSLPTTD